MSKKVSSKLLSLILCIAICCATLCGSLIAANAAAADFNGTYTITVGNEKNAVPFAATQVKAQVKFDLPAGFIGGQFKFVADSNYTIDDTVKVAAITTKDGSAYDIANVEINKKGDKYRFVIGDGSVLCTSITLEYTIVMNNYAAFNTNYPVGISLDDDDLVQFGTYDAQDISFTADASSASGFHAHGAWYDVSALTDVNGVATDLKNAELSGTKYVPVNNKDGKHTVASNTCTICEKVSYGPYSKSVQVIPDYTEFDGAQALFSGAIGWMGISGVTVNYDDDGTVDVNVHAYSLYKTDIVYLLVTDAEGNEIMRTATYNSAQASSYAGNGLVSGAKMFTLTDLSARDIDTDLLFTLIAVYDEGGVPNVHNSRTQAFNLADYCLKVVEGDAVWSDDATDDQIESDKDLAAALYYYGASIQDNVFDKDAIGGGNTDSSNAPQYINRTTVTWDGEYSSDYPVSNGYSSRTAEEKLANFNAFEATTEGSGNSADDPYVIDTIEEFIYVSQLMGTYSQNKYFKISDTIAKFDFGKWGDGVPKQINLIDNGSHFYGIFDGNGVEFVNLVGSGYHMALFPNTNAGAVIKNIKVTNASITASQHAGAIIANANGGTSTIDGCVVTDCNISGAGFVGVLAGVAGNNNSLVVKDCFVSNNTATTTNTSNRSNHIIGAGGWGTGTLKVNSSIVLGSDAYLWNITCTNVYADEADNTVGVVVTGAGAVDAMGLGSAWFDTDSYPELKAYHNFGAITVNETTHKTICLDKIDGVLCNLSLGTENHTLLPNAEGTAKVCDCGYSEEIIGNVVVPNNKVVVKWDTAKPATLAESGITGSGSQSDPYIIKTPAQLYYVTQKAPSAESLGMYYKVDDGIAAFDFGGTNWGLADHTRYFQGYFDGNGVEIRNFNVNGYHGALFPTIGGNVTIKNLKVVGATATSSSGQAGGIYANVSSGSTILIENCAVIDSVITTTASGCIGSIGGVTSGAILTVNDCFVSSSYSNARLIGYCNNSGHTVSNSIVNDVINDQFTTKTNVHKSADAQTGAGAVAEMGFGNAWFDTSAYPELRVFHDLVELYVDENTHQEVCQIFVNGVQCTTCGVVQNHDLTKNDESGLMECSCGYTEEIIGNAMVPNNKITVTWDGSTPSTLDAAAFTKGTGKENDPYIITTPAQLFYIAQYSGKDANSAGAYYKVADNIAVFDIANKNWWSGNTAFLGNIDGNGVEIINLKTSGYDSGLFPRASNATFKNIKIRNAAASASENGGHAGVFIGNVTSGTITIDGCSIVDSSVVADQFTGVLIGVVSNNNSAIVSDCFVANSTSTSRKDTCGANRMIGGGGWGTGKITVSDTIVIGLAAQSVSTSTNLYVDSAVKTGAGAVEAMGFDSDVWFDTASYPELKVFHDMQAVYADEDTHTTTCGIFVDGVKCTVCGVAENHELVLNAQGTAKECACGISEEVIGNAVRPNHVGYDEWDGTMTAPTKGSGTEVDPYIIENAEQLAFIALDLNGTFDTYGMYFKVADGIKAFNMMGMSNINVNSTSDEVKGKSNAGKIWRQTADFVSWGDNPNHTNAFGGNFDGNGVIIYNMHYGSGNGHGYSGLFPAIYLEGSDKMTLKNFTVAASYFNSYHATAGVIGFAYAKTTSSQISFENVVVKNNYIATNTHNQRGAGLIAEASHNKIIVNNCLIANNEIVAANMIGGFFANASAYNGGCDIRNSVIIGTVPTHPSNATIKAGATYAYTNIYTDQDFDSSYTGITKGIPTASQLGSEWFDTSSYPELSIFHDMTTIYIDENTHQTVCQIFINGVQCDVCQSATSHKMVGNNEGTYTECECGYGYEIKGIHAMNLPEAILNRITANSLFIDKFETTEKFKATYSADVYGSDTIFNEFDMYTTSLSLKVSNPHIGFMFAFNGEYKTNRANITATFRVEGQVIATVTGDQMTNNAGAGRYHLYRLKSLDVTKLCKPVTVTVTYGGYTYDFGTYSAAGYAINAMNAGAEYQEHVNASMALVYYSEMLAARDAA